MSTLSNAELNALAATYRRPIRHGINNDPNANASAFVNENQVFVNFGNLFPDGDAEIAQTLERVMDLGENRIEMWIPRSARFLRDLRFPHS